MRIGRGLAAACLALAAVSLTAQTGTADREAAPVSLAASPGGGAIRLREVSSFSRRVDGSYLGNVFRESRGILLPDESAPGRRAYRGDFFVLEDMIRETKSVARRVDRSASVDFSIAPDGRPIFGRDGGFPSLRGLPAAPPDGRYVPGARWEASGERVLDLEADGRFILLPFIAEYRCSGRIEYGGSPGIAVTAKFATRYRKPSAGGFGTGSRSGPAAKPRTPAAPDQPGPRPLPGARSPAPARTPRDGPAPAGAAPNSPAPAGASASSAASSGPRDETAIVEASGTHDLDIVLDEETRAPRFIRDRFDETYSFAGGGSERRNGFTLFFFEGATPLDRSGAQVAMLDKLGSRAERPVPGASASRNAPVSADSRGTPDSAAPPGAVPRADAAGAGPSVPPASPAGVASGAAGPDSLPPGAGPGPLLASRGEAELAASGIELGEVPAGLMLRIKDLRFVADSDEILASERGRLDVLASALAAIPGRSFLVEGHSASVGRAAGELELSVRRAERVAAELSARGVDPARLMYRGYGSTRPIAPNDDEENRAKNRRVEVTVLDF